MLFLTVAGTLILCHILLDIQDEVNTLQDTERSIFIQCADAVVFKDKESVIDLMGLFSSSSVESWRLVDSLGNIVSKHGDASFSLGQADVLSKVISIDNQQDIWRGSNKNTPSAERLKLHVKLITPFNNSVVIKGTLVYALIISLWVGLFSYSISSLLKKYKQKKIELIQLKTDLYASKEKQGQVEKSLAMNRENKSLFIADICHEIRTPLSNLQTLTELVADPKKIDKYGVTYSHTKRLLDSLLTDFIDMARQDREIFEVIPEWTNMVYSPFQAVRLATAENGRNHEIVYTASHKSVECYVDSRRISQIIVNLITNAIKYAGKYIHVNVSLEEISAEDGVLMISVRDSGKGIPENKRNKVFDAFSKVQNETQSYEGIGLGLHIAKMLVDKMGGYICYREAVPQGANFEISIPCKYRNSKKHDLNGEGRVAVISERDSVCMLAAQAFSEHAFVEQFRSDAEFFQAIMKSGTKYDAILTHEFDLEDNELQGTSCYDSPVIDISKRTMYSRYKKGLIPSNFLTSDSLLAVSSGISFGNSKSKYILILDDTASNYLNLRIRTEGSYVIHIASNTTDAINHLYSFKYEAVFIDLYLNGEHCGYHFASLMRIHGLNKDIKAILYTGSPARSQIELSFIAGVDGLLKKGDYEQASIERMIKQDAGLESIVEISNVPTFIEEALNKEQLDYTQFKSDMAEYLKRDALEQTVFDEMASYLSDIPCKVEFEQLTTHLLKRVGLLQA